MNKFEIDLLNQAFQHYIKTGKAESSYQARNGDGWLYYSEALHYLEREGYIMTNDGFKTDESNFFAATKPIRYELTQQGLTYCKENLRT